jgi:hypothetical protein
MLFLCLAFGYAIHSKQGNSVLGYVCIQLHHKFCKADSPSVVVFIFLLVIAVLLMDILQIVKLLNHSLTPNALLAINAFQAGFWGVILVLNIVYIVKFNASVASLYFPLGLL